MCPLPGRRGGGGVCRLILTVPGGGTGPGASRLRRTPSAVRGGQSGCMIWPGPATSPWRRTVWTSTCLLSGARGVALSDSLSAIHRAVPTYLARLLSFCGALFTVEIAPLGRSPVPLARSGAACGIRLWLLLNALMGSPGLIRAFLRESLPRGARWFMGILGRQLWFRVGVVGSG